MMDKDSKAQEAQSDTSSVITIKEYASSEYPASEPPPAYIKPRSTILQVARLAAFTIIASAVILGGFILAASWIQANSARNLDLTLNQELLDELQQPSYEHLIANEALTNDIDNNIRDNAESANKNYEKTEKQETKEQEDGLSQEQKMPMELDAIANILMQKNMKGKVNCIVEKRRNEELVDHAPKSLNLPFGLNITTPPRLQHVTGEQMVVICKDDDDDKEDDKEPEPTQPVVFPLPANLINQIQQIPQIIPLNQLLQELPVQQPQTVYYPQQQQQQMIYQQPQYNLPQQVIYQQPHQQQQQQFVYQQPPPQQQMFLPPPPPQQQQQQIYYHQQQQQPQQQVVYHQPPPPPQMYQQQPFPQVQPQFEVDNQLSDRDMVPLREVRTNQQGMPLNHFQANPMPINPMAMNDVPLSQMPLTHLPMRMAEEEKHQEPPVHHLVPPQPQDMQSENFNQQEEGPEMFRPAFRRPSPMFDGPFGMPPRFTRPRPNFVEIREPRVLNLPKNLNQRPRERLPFPLSLTEVHANRLQEDSEERMPPVQGRMLPMSLEEEIKEHLPFLFRNKIEESNAMPVRGVPFPFVRDLDRPTVEKVKIIKMIPLNGEKRQMPFANRIRFPESDDSEEMPRESRMPVITQITKIIPIRIEKEGSEMNRLPMIPLRHDDRPDIEIKSLDDVDNKVEKLDSAFPIPINAILDMVFRGIKPLMNQQGPIELKIERLDKNPMEVGTGKPMIELDFDKAFQNGELIPLHETQTPQISTTETPEMPSPSDLMLEENEGRVEQQEQREETEDKMENFEEREQETTEEVQENTDTIEIKESPTPSWNQLPNGEGRGARAFAIPPQSREMVDSRTMEIPMRQQINVENPADQDQRQGRIMTFQPISVEGEVTLDSKASARSIEPQSLPINVEKQTFTINDAKNAQMTRLLPVAPEKLQNEPVSASPVLNDESLPRHVVMPRSV